jgi:hypothetical protein
MRANRAIGNMKRHVPFTRKDVVFVLQDIQELEFFIAFGTKQRLRFHRFFSVVKVSRGVQRNVNVKAFVPGKATLVGWDRFPRRIMRLFRA